MINFFKRIVCRFKGHKIYVQCSFDQNIIACCERKCGSRFVAAYTVRTATEFHAHLLEIK